MKCNICGCDEFVAMGSRPRARCAACGSLERTRLLWMFLRDIDLPDDCRVLHLAPEKGLYEALKGRIRPENYELTDIDPKRYGAIPGVKRLDLCDLDALPTGFYDLIIHSHVLEHVPCNIAYPLYHLHRSMKPDGLHVCVIPFMNGYYDESFAEIGPDERVRRFGQFDHVRRFGKEDIPKHLGSVLDLSGHVDAARCFSEEAFREANIPASSGYGFSIDTVLRLRRGDMKLLGEPGRPDAGASACASVSAGWR